MTDCSILPGGSFGAGAFGGMPYGTGVPGYAAKQKPIKGNALKQTRFLIIRNI